MDPQTEQAVWRRVTSPRPIQAQEALLPERLEALILEERTQAAALRALAGRLRGQERAGLLRLASRVEAGAGELTTLHYLLTGRRLRLQAPAPERNGPLPERLRELTLRRRQSVKAYESLQAEFTDFAGDFSRFASEARAQERELTRLLQSQLRTNK